MKIDDGATGAACQENEVWCAPPRGRGRPRQHRSDLYLLPAPPPDAEWAPFRNAAEPRPQLTPLRALGSLEVTWRKAGNSSGGEVHPTRAGLAQRCRWPRLSCNQGL